MTNEIYLLTGGEATRLKPLSEGIPKALLTIQGEKIIDLIIAKFLKTNNTRFERISDDTLVSARAITLFASCQKCHVSALSQQNGGRKVAGLVIEIPLIVQRKE